MHLGYIELEKVCISLIWNLKTVCWQVDCRQQVFQLQCAQFRATSSNAIISKTKDFLWIFYCISEMCMKFWKKRWVSLEHLINEKNGTTIILFFHAFGIYWDEYPSLIISEIMDCERGGILLKRLKGLASEDHAVINVLTGSKHCWNQHGTTIILFFHAFGIYWVGKSLP